MINDDRLDSRSIFLLQILGENFGLYSIQKTQSDIDKFFRERTQLTLSVQC